MCSAVILTSFCCTCSLRQQNCYYYIGIRKLTYDVSILKLHQSLRFKIKSNYLDNSQCTKAIMPNKQSVIIDRPVPQPHSQIKLAKIGNIAKIFVFTIMVDCQEFFIGLVQGRVLEFAPLLADLSRRHNFWGKFLNCLVKLL